VIVALDDAAAPVVGTVRVALRRGMQAWEKVVPRPEAIERSGTRSEMP
jgi:hypothetical protein